MQVKRAYLIFVKKNEKSVRIFRGSSLDFDDAVIVVFDLPDYSLRIRIACRFERKPLYILLVLTRS